MAIRPPFLDSFPVFFSAHSARLGLLCYTTRLSSDCSARCCPSDVPAHRMSLVRVSPAIRLARPRPSHRWRKGPRLLQFDTIWPLLWAPRKLDLRRFKVTETLGVETFLGLNPTFYPCCTHSATLHHLLGSIIFSFPIQDPPLFWAQKPTVDGWKWLPLTPGLGVGRGLPGLPLADGWQMVVNVHQEIWLCKWCMPLYTPQNYQF